MANIVYIATSIDGYIADKNGGLEWLNIVPNPNHDDFGWADFMSKIDAIVMGATTFKTVDGFDCPWPYKKPVLVLSNSLKELDKKYAGKAELINGTPAEITSTLNQKGFKNLYIDGGNIIQQFLRDELINELIITTIPIVLGGGAKLFADLSGQQQFEHVKTEILLNQMVKTHYKRKT